MRAPKPLANAQRSGAFCPFVACQFGEPHWWPILAKEAQPDAPPRGPVGRLAVAEPIQQVWRAELIQQAWQAQRLLVVLGQPEPPVRAAALGRQKAHRA